MPKDLRIPNRKNFKTICFTITSGCLQETHNISFEYYITDAGFLVTLSGDEDGCFAGIGFIVAPHCRRCVASFCLECCRQVSLKLRIPGGKMVVCSAYAPHSGRPFKEKQRSFQTAADWMSSLSRTGPLLALCDFNARLHKMHARESHLIGPQIFGNKNAYFNAEWLNPIGAYCWKCANLSGCLLQTLVSTCPWKNKSPCTTSVKFSKFWSKSN